MWFPEILWLLWSRIMHCNFAISFEISAEKQLFPKSIICYDWLLLLLLFMQVAILFKSVKHIGIQSTWRTLVSGEWSGILISDFTDDFEELLKILTWCWEEPGHSLYIYSIIWHERNFQLQSFYFLTPAAPKKSFDQRTDGSLSSL